MRRSCVHIVVASVTSHVCHPGRPGTCVGSARRRLRCVVEARVQVLDDAHGFGTARRRSGLEHRDQAEELVVIVLVDGELAIAANSIFGRSTQSIACDENVVAGSIFRQAPCRPRVRWSARKSSNSIPSACMRPRRDFAISHCPAGSAVPSYFRKRLRSTADGLSALPKQRPSQRDALALASAGGLVLCDAHQLAQRLGLCLRYVRPE